ncbi:MAG: hypothetical protein MHMPM18_002848 [Marteilia pararefringens]
MSKFGAAGGEEKPDLRKGRFKIGVKRSLTVTFILTLVLYTSLRVTVPYWYWKKSDRIEFLT